MQKIYIELIFLNNFVVNLLILLFASLITGSKKRWGRLAASAAIGGIYASAAVGASGFGISFLTKAAVSAIMCFIAYYIKNEKNFWKNVCAFYIITFVFAGAIYGITFCFGQPETLGGAIAVKPLVSNILIGLGAATVIICIFSRVRKRTLERESRTVTVNVTYGKRTAAIKAFVDTGNMLTEPISGLEVVFVSMAAGRELFDNDTIALLNCRGLRLTEKLRIIPVMTATGAGLFYGIEIDSITLRGQKQGIKAVVCIAKGSLAYGCEAVIGAGIIDKLMKGAGHDKVFCEENSGMDIAAVGNSAECGLYKRERSAASSAYAGGGKLSASNAGAGGQVSKASIDRA
jgi:stage II sporulation protein GA (sporulation sigma-E factor processing peptidase)